MRQHDSPLQGKTILLVNTGSIKKRFIIQRLKRLGLTIVVLNREKNWAQQYVDHWIIADNTNYNEAISAIKEFLSANPHIKLDGALTFWEDDVLLTSRIVDKFNLTGVPYGIAKNVRNKFLFREFCRTHDIPTPQHLLVKHESDLQYLRDQFAFPIVIKPAYGSSSAYVVKVEKKEGLTDLYRYVKNNLSTSIESALSDGLDIFAEEYIDGDEVDIDILLQNGRIKFYSISDNFNKDKGLFFVDSGQAIPSSLPANVQSYILEMAEMTVEKLGIQNACIHFEAKHSKKGFFPIEVNLRMGGDYVYSYTKSAWGIDLIEYAVKIAIGQYIPKIHAPETPKKYIIGWDLHPDESGMLVELDNPDTLKKLKYVEEVEIYKHIGDPILVPPEGFEHLGWLTVTGENTIDAQDNLEDILTRISYKVVKFDPESSLGKTERKSRTSAAVLNKNLLIRTARLKAINRGESDDIKNLKIGILANIYKETSDPIAKNITESATAVQKTLETIGYHVSTINLNNFLGSLDVLRKGEIDLIFNLGERLYDDDSFKPQITAIVDALQIPYTGSDVFTHSLAADKIRFKKLLAYHEIPTPAWDYAYELEDEIDDELEFPLIVKPSSTDYCLGITDQSIVTNRKELQRELERIIRTMKRPALIEEYIDGDEYEVYILGNGEENLRVLPLCRTIFHGGTQKPWHINTYESKWLQRGDQAMVTRQLPPKNISKKIESLITEIALDTYNILNCKDYGRVDVKVDRDDNPYVLEVNPAPWLNYSDPHGLASAAKLAGISFENLLEEIIRLSIERYKSKATKT
ncbi:MAG: ATP-grasp domain-containing protein [Patescibacteria group bacterium]